MTDELIGGVRRASKAWLEAYARAERVMDGISRLAVKAGDNSRWADALGSSHDDIEWALTAGFMAMTKRKTKPRKRAKR